MCSFVFTHNHSEVIEKYPQLRSEVLSRLIDSFSEIKNGKVFRGALWVVGEYADDIDSIEKSFEKIRQVLGPLPILAPIVVSLETDFH